MHGGQIRFDTATSTTLDEVGKNGFIRSNVGWGGPTLVVKGACSLFGVYKFMRKSTFAGAQCCSRLLALERCILYTLYHPAGLLKVRENVILAPHSSGDYHTVEHNTVVGTCEIVVNFGAACIQTHIQHACMQHLSKSRGIMNIRKMTNSLK
jgi:hypothetical protein